LINVASAIQLYLTLNLVMKIVLLLFVFVLFMWKAPAVLVRLSHRNSVSPSHGWISQERSS